MTNSLPDRFAASMGQLLGPDFPSDLALAVSGGGDSMAMLALAHDWARVFGVRLWVVTIDHGLRDTSAAEAAMVAQECALLGHPHATLRWHWDGSGNLQDAARRARLDLIDRWRGRIGHVLFAHTQDDVAETFVMRLARGSGVEGLSAMAARRGVRPNLGPVPVIPVEDVIATASPPQTADDATPPPGFTLIRPLLHETRADLRHHARTLKLPHVEDPSNKDPRFERARVRAALEGLGIGADQLAATAHRMARAQEALLARMAEVAARVASTDLFGTFVIDRDGFAPIERDTQLRLLAAALCWVSSAEYRPRATALEGLLERALSGGGGTLHGAEVRVGASHIEVFREFRAVRDVTASAGASSLWDRRWLVYGSAINGLAVRALGPDGWRQVQDAIGAAAPLRRPSFPVAQSLPAVFDGDRLVAFKACGFGPDHVAELRPVQGSFAGTLHLR